MPSFDNAAGTLNPDAGIDALATFRGVLDTVPTRGFVPAPDPLLNSPSDVLRADRTWGTGGTAAALVPAMAFTAAASGAAGQSFQNDSLKLYSLAQDIQLFVNRTTKLVGQPLGNDFSLDNLTGTITVTNALSAGASLFIDSKVILGQGSQTYYFLNEDGLSKFLNENGIDIFRTETP